MIGEEQAVPRRRLSNDADTGTDHPRDRGEEARRPGGSAKQPSSDDVNRRDQQEQENGAAYPQRRARVHSSGGNVNVRG
jgi:hypothetical protein